MSGGWFLAGVLRRGGGRGRLACPGGRAGSCCPGKARRPAPQGPATPQVGKNHPPRPPRTSLSQAAYQGPQCGGRATSPRAVGALSPVGQCPEDVQLAAEHREVLPELVFPLGVHGRRAVQCRGRTVQRVFAAAQVVADSPQRLHGGRVIDHSDYDRPAQSERLAFTSDYLSVIMKECPGIMSCPASASTA